MSPPRFKPAWWMRNAHIQTIVPSRLRKLPELPIQRQRLELSDGDFLDLDFIHQSDPEAPIILLIHGLEGSTESQYIKAMMNQALKRGWHAVGMHFRGCSGEDNRLPRSYHSGESGDVDQVISHLQQQYPQSPMAAVGYSLGGSALLNWLSDSNNSQRLNAAGAVSVPFDLAMCANRMNHGFSRVYRNHFMKTLHHKIRQKIPLLEKHRIELDLAALDNSNDFWVFDHHITAPLHGFKSAEDYYQRCSTKPKLINIDTHTLIIHALDDPFMPNNSAPRHSEVSESIELELCQHGGHLGFVSGQIPFRPRYDWLENRMCYFLEQHLK